MQEQHIGSRQREIVDQLGCSAQDASMVEDIMRKHIFHSTLDWQSEVQLQRGAREAWQILEADREMFEKHYQEVRGVFAEMKRREG